jgi:hypothetical protein
MLKQSLRYGTGLIALYIVVANASGFGQALISGAEGGSRITRTLQGR